MHHISVRQQLETNRFSPSVEERAVGTRVISPSCWFDRRGVRGAHKCNSHAKPSALRRQVRCFEGPLHALHDGPHFRHGTSACRARAQQQAETHVPPIPPSLSSARRKTRHTAVAQHGQSSPSVPARFPTACPTESGCGGQTGCSAHVGLQGCRGAAVHCVAPTPPVRAGAQTMERGRRPPKATPRTSVSASRAESPPEVPTSHSGPHGELLPRREGCQNAPEKVRG